MDKTKKVMEALKNRKGFNPKKEKGNLLGIMAKLTKKRKDGCGGPGLDSIKKTGSDFVKGAKNFGWDAMDVLERGKLKEHEIPMRYQPDFVKKMHKERLPRTIGEKIGGNIGAGIGKTVGMAVKLSPIGSVIGAASILKKLKQKKQDDLSTGKSIRTDIK